jgi:hypothetical protein
MFSSYSTMPVSSLEEVVGQFRRKCPINFSLSWRYDKLKLIGHRTDPLRLEEARREVPRPGSSSVFSNHYPIGTSEAVWKHLIPFLNLIWIFQWPKEFSEYLNERGRVRIVSGNLIGLLILVSLLLRFSTALWVWPVYLALRPICRLS